MPPHITSISHGRDRVRAARPLRVRRRLVTPRTVAELRAELATASLAELPALLELLACDERQGVRTACRRASTRLERARRETARLEALYSYEVALMAGGCMLIAGVDEVGRGALAGPLTAAAVILPPGPHIDGLDDSKRLTPERREQVARQVRAVALAVSVAHVSPPEIDALGMTRAVHRAMSAALAALGAKPDHVLVDGRPVGLVRNETAIVKGDSKVASIAAASVVAKVDRDALMRDLGADYPGYAFELNKGYGSPEHLDTIASRGLTDQHRRSFAPCGGTLPLF